MALDGVKPYAISPRFMARSNGGGERLHGEKPSLEPLPAHRVGARECGSRLAASARKELRARMLRAAIAFFILAIIAAAFGYTGLAAGAAGIAKILAVVFLVLAVLGILFGTFIARKAV